MNLWRRIKMNGLKRRWNDYADRLAEREDWIASRGPWGFSGNYLMKFYDDQAYHRSGARK